MNKNFQDNIELRLHQNFGPSRFATFMIKHIEQWQEMSFTQLLEIIDRFKYDGCTYSLFPFVYGYLKIDIYGLYKELANKYNWDPEKVKNQMSSFKSHILTLSDKSIRLNSVKNSEEILLEISKRLIREGAPSCSNG